MRRPGLMLVIALAIVASACADSGGPTTSDWQAEIPTSLEESPFRGAVTAYIAASLTADPLVPASCVDQVATSVTDILFTDLGVVGLRNLGVSADDPSAVETEAFIESLPQATKGRIVAAVADCGGLTRQLSAEIPGVSYGSLACLVDRLSASGFFEMGRGNGAAAATFASANNACLDPEEQVAYDAWSANQLAAPAQSVVLAPVDCASIDTARFSAALGFDIDHFEPSVIKMDADRPVGCTFGNPDEPGPWVLLYVATQDFQRGLYEAYESPIPEVAATWSTLTEVLEYAGVYFVSQGGTVEWYEGAVTATFANGNTTTAALTAGDYVLMVSAGRGNDGPPLSRAHLAGAVEALAVALALS